jgi:SCY1-like protein 1
MQLGNHASSTLSHAAEWAAEAEVETSNPWGNDDLMDVNADQNDWSEVSSHACELTTLTSGLGAFETAPVLGHETYDERPVKAPAPARAESEHPYN